MPNPTTGTRNSGTKVDHGSSLAGNQSVSNVGGTEDYFESLPWSYPQVEHCESEFFHGFACTEAPGKVHPHSGHTDI